MSALGNASKQPADPSYNLPPKNFWAYSQDSAFYAAVSVTVNIIFAVVILFICGLLALFFSKTPRVITQEHGIPSYRTTREFRNLDTKTIHTYLRIVTETLLSYRSPENDVSDLNGLVSENIIAAFNNLSKKNAEGRRLAESRQFWEAKEIRRYYNSELPNYIGIAIQGKKTIIRKSRELERREPEVFTSTPLVVVYLKQQPMNYTNPWGLLLVGIQEQTNPEKAKIIWDQSVALAGTLDLEEKSILPPRKEYLPKPIFEKIRFYNWLKNLNP